MLSVNPFASSDWSSERPDPLIGETKTTGNEEKGTLSTIRELSCMMGFPIDYQFIGKTSNIKHKQIGNAVCVHMSLALANAIKTQLNIVLEDSERVSRNISETQQNFVNLNNLKAPIYSTYVSKSKKIDSKFHIHVPYVKINQLRVELDNLESEFVGQDSKMFKWTASLHKGSGKTAQKTLFGNDELIAYIREQNEFDNVTKFVDTLKPRLYDSYLFQQKNCQIASVDKDNHFAPYELLNTISGYVRELDIVNNAISIPELDDNLKYNKANMYPTKVLYSLYIMNQCVSFLK